MQLLDKALELVAEKKECMTVVLRDTIGRRRVEITRVDEIDVLLEENNWHLRKFNHLKERLNMD